MNTVYEDKNLVMVIDSSVRIPAVHRFANPKAEDYREYESGLIRPEIHERYQRKT